MLILSLVTPVQLKNKTKRKEKLIISITAAEIYKLTLQDKSSEVALWFMFFHGEFPKVFSSICTVNFELLGTESLSSSHFQAVNLSTDEEK